MSYRLQLEKGLAIIIRQIFPLVGEPNIPVYIARHMGEVNR